MKEFFYNITWWVENDAIKFIIMTGMIALIAIVGLTLAMGGLYLLCCFVEWEWLVMKVTSTPTEIFKNLRIGVISLIIISMVVSGLIYDD